MSRPVIDRLLEAIRREAEAFYGERLVSLAVFGSHASGCARPHLARGGPRDLVTNSRLGQSYVERAQGRLPFLRQMQAVGLHADVVCESQQVVELALYGDEDFIPSDEYDVADSTDAIASAERSSVG